MDGGVLSGVALLVEDGRQIDVRAEVRLWTGGEVADEIVPGLAAAQADEPFEQLIDGLVLIWWRPTQIQTGATLVLIAHAAEHHFKLPLQLFVVLRRNAEDLADHRRSKRSCKIGDDVE